MLKGLMNKSKGRFWLIIGLISYMLITGSSILRSIQSTSFYDNFYMAIDWLAACVIYFFLAALIGRIFDVKKQKKHPLWFWLTIVLWTISSVSAAIFARPDTLNIWLILFFPFAFGVFFTGYAFSILFPKLIIQYEWLKLALDFIFLTVFGLWLNLEIKNKRPNIRKVLLSLIFAIFFLGLYGCVSYLA